jgi:2-polyprenyl-3-methyl-5-hydroxy-6-metoxy-1,4-benzoquinol methylase
MSDLESRPCPVCASASSEEFSLRPDGLVVESCKTCGMMFVRRVPSENQLAKYYQAYASLKGYAKPRPKTWLERAAYCAQSIYIEALEETGGIVGRTVLDFGCSVGDFLDAVRFRGGRPEGIEIDAPAREEAQRRGFTVSAGIPESGQYDVTSAFQVLEHLAKPGDMVDAMYRLTKPEGRILLATPNASEVAKLGSDWLGFRVDLEHFNYFTIQTMAELLRRHKVLIEHFWEHRQPNIVRTDIGDSGATPTLLERARLRVRHAAATAHRLLYPPPERFLEGTFTLSLLARKI